MPETPKEIKLRDGTLIRHKVAGYEGRIDGTTGIRSCFTAGGELLPNPTTKQTFQYRVVIDKELMRRIAPAEDLEILEGPTEVICPQCRYSFQSLPGSVDKPAGRCHCGGWICPSCLACQDPNQTPVCARQLKRVARMLTRRKPR
jgi:hypothetical protein